MKTCPVCGRELRLQKNWKNKENFWGCIGYFDKENHCSYSESYNEKEMIDISDFMKEAEAFYRWVKSVGHLCHSKKISALEQFAKTYWNLDVEIKDKFDFDDLNFDKMHNPENKD